MLSKQTMAGAGVGAALAAAVFVTVYEGKVLFANDRGEAEVSAGERVRATADTAPARLVTGGDEPIAIATPDVVGADDRMRVDAPPAGDATREQLLARDQTQRERIARLEQQVAQLEQASRGRTGGPGPDGDEPAWFEANKEQLIRYAKECRVDSDMPPFFAPEPQLLPVEQADKLEMTAAEVVAFNKLVEAFHARVHEQLRAMYVEATGDIDGSHTLSAQAMIGEIVDKSPAGERDRVNQRIAQERAGLVPRPSSTEGMGVVERYLRMSADLGSDFEEALADEIGPVRARQIRSANGGWPGMRMVTKGCPDSGEPGEHDEDTN